MKVLYKTMTNKPIPELEKLQKIEATFRPTDTKTLRIEWLSYIGKTMIWYFVWTQEEDEPYPGQRTFIINEIQYPNNPHHWVPECDLDFIRIVS